MARTRQRRIGSQRGGAVAELAIVLPLFVMLVVGIIEFGMALNTQVSIQSAAREGARSLALGNSTTSVETTTRNAAPSVSIDSVSQTACPTDPDPADRATVTVRESYRFAIPFVPLGTRTLTATAVMRCGL